jgi:hypothetical protein
MGNKLRLACLVAAVSALAGSAKSNRAALEPYETPVLQADEGSLRRAFIAMLRSDMEPAIDPGAAAAFGERAAIATPWVIEPGLYHRWVVYVMGEQLMIRSVCFTLVEEVVEIGGSKRAINVKRPCRDQPIGRSRLAAELAEMIGYFPSAAPAAPSVDPFELHSE